MCTRDWATVRARSEAARPHSQPRSKRVRKSEGGSSEKRARFRKADGRVTHVAEAHPLNRLPCHCSHTAPSASKQKYRLLVSSGEVTPPPQYTPSRTCRVSTCFASSVQLFSLRRKAAHKTSRKWR